MRESVPHDGPWARPSDERSHASQLARRLGLTACALLLAGHFAPAQESAEKPAPRKGGVQITFLPPPVEGPVSLGMYDKTGKLVRALHRGSTKQDFVVGLNGFITHWDGRDDAGRLAPAGMYAARGYALGNVEIEGVAMLGNEWITDAESPRVRLIASIYPRQDAFILIAQMAGEGAAKAFECMADGAIGEEVPFESVPNPKNTNGLPGAKSDSQALSPWMEIKDGNVILAEALSRRVLPLPGLMKPLAACPARNGAWVIDDRGDGVVEVKEFSLEGEIKRRLVIDPGEPQPRDIIAVPGRDAIVLIEEKPGTQRVRGLALETPAEPAPENDERVSTWKVFLSKTIHGTDTFGAAVPHLGREKPFAPEERIKLQLAPNPLFKDALAAVEVQIAHDPNGSFFRTVDGLPLVRISETPHLKWTVMGREGGKVITVFQSDGAVVEEFKVRKLAGMMAFDAGEYEWSGK